MTVHELDLLDNALDSLTEALAKFEEGDSGEQKSYKFAVLHMAHFIELLFKYHIASKHPLLIYKDPFAKSIDKSKTIGLWEAINFINNEAPDTVSSDFRKDLEWIKKLRNEIEHHRFIMDVHQVRTTIGRLFRSVIEFIEEYTHINIEEYIPAHTKDTFKVLSDEYEFSVRNAVMAAEEISKNNFVDYSSDPDAAQSVFDCPECGHFTLALDENSDTGYRCTFCKNEESEELPAICDICGVNTTKGDMAYWENEYGDLEGRCYYCSGMYHTDKDD